MKLWQKKYKILISVFVTIFAVIAVVFTAINSARYAPVKYLSEKYGINKKEFKCVEYSPRHYYLDFDNIGQGWSTPMWIYKYEDNEFIVKKIENVYYDDFQYDEYRNWCIDFLESILDENVIDVEVDSLTFFDNNEKMTNSDFEELFRSKYRHSVLFYITFDDIQPYLENKELTIQKCQDIKRRINETGLSERAYIYICDKSVKFTKSTTYLDGYHNYLSLYESCENFQNLVEQGRATSVNDELYICSETKQ